LIENLYGTNATLLTAVDYRTGGANTLSVLTEGGQTISFAGVNLNTGYTTSALSFTTTNVIAKAPGGAIGAGGQQAPATFTNSLSGNGAANFTTIMQGSFWNIGSLTFTNLVIGQSYAFTLFTSDERTGSTYPRTNLFSDTFTTNAVAENPAYAEVGSFTALSNAETINITAIGNGTNGVNNDFTILSAVTFYSVPEPASYVLFGLGALVLGISLRRRSA
jgi:hypothetical protein